MEQEKWTINGFKILDAEENAVCEYNENTDGPLLAAAPELLAVLKLLVSVEHNLRIPSSYINKMHLVIAKAGGR